MAKDVKEFEVGDMVVLKSGRPKMSITNVLAGGLIESKWFAGLKSERDVFRSANLNYAPEEATK